MSKSFSNLSLLICTYITMGVAYSISFFLKKKRIIQKKTLYLPTFFPNNAGYIYRVQKWKEKLEENGYEVDVKTTLSEKQFYTFFKKNDVRFFIIPLIKRTWQIINSRKYDTVIVRREILLYNDYGNLFLEKLLLKIHPNAILDFDDDIAYAKMEPREINSLFGKIMLENGNKFTESLKLYRKFIVGSDYLKNLVLEKNAKITKEAICVIPTCVDYNEIKSKNYSAILSQKVISIGWIGSNGNLKLLESIIDDLNSLNQIHPIRLIVISGKLFTPKVDFEIENISWNYETHITDLLKIDIGVMPLFNTREDKGKCGFKLIQYMGLGVVSVASAVTINKLIIDDKINGFLVSSDKNNWLETLVEVINRKDEFEKIGNLAQIKIKEHYSFAANEQKYVKFIQNLEDS